MARKIFSAIVLLLFCAFSSVSAYADSFEENKNKAKQGVVIIYSDNGDDTGSSGTGFAIGLPQNDVFYFITNFHCVSKDDKIPNIKNQVISGREGHAYGAEVVYFDPVQDYAILKTYIPVENVVPLRLSKENISENQEIFIIGYPTEAMDVKFNENGKMISVKDPTNIITTSGEITSLEGKGNPAIKSFSTSAHANDGNSGGPIIDKETGAVIGVVCAKYVPDEKDKVVEENDTDEEAEKNNESIEDEKEYIDFTPISYGIDIKCIIDSLNALEIEYATFSAPIVSDNETKAVSNENCIIENVIVLLLIILIILSVVIICIMIRIKNYILQKMKNQNMKKF